jgi:hypothetical protein
MTYGEGTITPIGHILIFLAIIVGVVCLVPLVAMVRRHRASDSPDGPAVHTKIQTKSGKDVATSTD